MGLVILMMHKSYIAKVPQSPRLSMKAWILGSRSYRHCGVSQKCASLLLPTLFWQDCLISHLSKNEADVTDQLVTSIHLHSYL